MQAVLHFVPTTTFPSSHISLTHPFIPFDLTSPPPSHNVDNIVTSNILYLSSMTGDYIKTGTYSPFIVNVSIAVHSLHFLCVLV